MRCGPYPVQWEDEISVVCFTGVSQPMFHNPAPTYGGAITPLIDAKVLANALDNSNYGQCYNLDVTAIGSLFDQFIAHDIIKSTSPPSFSPPR